MANSTKKDIVLKLRREERMAIRATRFMQKPMTIRQTKRTVSIAIVGAVFLLILTVLRFTIFEAAFEPFVYDIDVPKPKLSPSPSPVRPLSIEELEKQADLTDGPIDKKPR